MSRKRKIEEVDHDHAQRSILMGIITEAAGEFGVIKAITGYDVINDGDHVDNSKLPGIHFKPSRSSPEAGHFYYRDKDGKVFNSYSLRWQKPGSNGFCQTFAMMAALGLTDKFVPGALNDNSQICCRFLAGHAKSLHPAYKSIVKKTWYDYDQLDVKELAEDINALASSLDFGTILLSEVVYT